ncbi:MAG: SpaA isopeptide-forming pilin-related protein [Chthoniobacterales bacterium]
MKKLLLLVLLLVSGLAFAQVASGLEGSIMISPVMGGPTRAGSPDAKPLPATEFVVQQDGKVITTFRTDAQGKFKVSLGPGHYTVTKKERAKIGSFGPFEVEVAPGKMKSVEWMCDSGIR